MKAYLEGIILGLTIGILTTAAVFVAFNKPVIQKVCELGNIKITESTDGICYLNNGFIPTDFIISCKDKEKILRKGCK